MPLRDITPERYRGGPWAPACPSVFEDGEGHILITGSRIEPGPLHPGPDEAIVRIPVGMLDNLGGPLTRMCRRIGL